MMAYNNGIITGGSGSCSGSGLRVLSGYLLASLLPLTYLFSSKGRPLFLLPRELALPCSCSFWLGVSHCSTALFPTKVVHCRCWVGVNLLSSSTALPCFQVLYWLSGWPGLVCALTLFLLPLHCFPYSSHSPYPVSHFLTGLYLPLAVSLP